MFHGAGSPCPMIEDDPSSRTNHGCHMAPGGARKVAAAACNCRSSRPTAAAPSSFQARGWTIWPSMNVNTSRPSLVPSPTTLGAPSKPTASRCRSRPCTAGVQGPAERYTIAPCRNAPDREPPCRGPSGETTPINTPDGDKALRAISAARFASDQIAHCALVTPPRHPPDGCTSTTASSASTAPSNRATSPGSPTNSPPFRRRRGGSSESPGRMFASIHQAVVIDRSLVPTGGLQ